MGEFGPWHLLIVAGVFIILFGAKKLPEAARALGRSARIMKSEIHALHDDDAPVSAVSASPAVPVAISEPARETARTV